MSARAQAFHDIVKPVFSTLSMYTLVDCCCGDGKAGAAFDMDENVSDIIFIDIREVGKFRRTTAGLRHPHRLTLQSVAAYEPVAASALIAVHACGSLTDVILRAAADRSLPVAVMPCCYAPGLPQYSLISPPDHRRLMYPRPQEYYDAHRVRFLEEHGYRVSLTRIDTRISPMNNVLVGVPLQYTQ